MRLHGTRIRQDRARTVSSSARGRDAFGELGEAGIRGDTLFNFARHFGLLGLFTAALAVAGPRAGPGIGAQFALYGALHAAAVTLSLATARGLHRAAGSCSWHRRDTRPIDGVPGLRGLHRLSRLELGVSAVAIIAACAGLGALAYGVSIRGILAAPSVLPGGGTRSRSAQPRSAAPPWRRSPSPPAGSFTPQASCGWSRRGGLRSRPASGTQRPETRLK